jgi:hypothetical protein
VKRSPGRKEKEIFQGRRPAGRLAGSARGSRTGVSPAAAIFTDTGAPTSAWAADTVPEAAAMPDRTTVTSRE